MNQEDLFKKYYETHFANVHPNIIDAELKNVEISYPYFYKQFLPEDKESKIIDIGCGLGHFLYALKIMGYKNFEGIDLSINNIKLVKEKITPNAFVGDGFEYLSKKTGFYDIIHLKDVIEHIPKTRILDCLKIIFNALKPGGKVIIGTNNALGSPSAVLMGRYMDFTHETIFSEWSLKQILEIAGFDKVIILPTELNFKNLSFKGKIHYLIFKKPDYFFRKLYLRLTGIRPLPKILHWHMTAVAQRPKK